MFRTILVLIIQLVTVGFVFADSDEISRETPIVRAYQKVEQSVVNISGTRTVAIHPRSAYEFFFGKRRFNQSSKMQRFELGSGVVVHEDGYIVTNAHVVEDSDQIYVTFSNGKEYEAELIQSDQKNDLGFLKINSGEKFKAVDLGKSCDILIGETVIAVGNPLGYSSTVTEGIVSALGRDIKVSDDYWIRGLIQTSAPINPGNSGGPLLNINGKLIGINTAISAQAQNIGFAIPIDTVADNLIHMLMPEEMRRVNLGLIIGRMECYDSMHGLLIESIIEGSPAEKQGLKPEDLILSIEGEEVRGFIDFYVKIMEKEIGDEVQIEYVRPSENLEKRYSAKLEIKSRPLPDGKRLAKDYFQITIEPLDQDNAKRYEFDKPYSVLIVTNAYKGGVAQESGIQEGDIILEFNNKSISHLKDLSLSIEKIKPGDEVTVRILRVGWNGRFQTQKEYLVRMKAQIRKTTKLNYL